MTLNSIKQILSEWQPSILVHNNIVVEWTLPTSLDYGILTTNCAFHLAKSLKQNPIQLVEELKKDLEVFILDKSLVIKGVGIPSQAEDDGIYLGSVLVVKAAGPYINLEFTTEAFGLLNFDLNINQESDVINFEYVSNNAAKPLHAGHSRNINLGEVLRRCMLLKYPNLKTNNYWGDWGVQFGILLWGYKQFVKLGKIEVVINDQKKIFEFESEDKLDIDTLVAIYIWANQKKETTENFDQIVRDEFLALEKGEVENERIRQFLVDISIKSVNEEIGLLNAPEHDYQLGESFYAQKVPELYEYFETNKIWKADGLARYFDLEEIIDGWVDAPEVLKKQKKSLGRCYLVSSNGYSSYAFRDIACRIDLIKSLHADKMITITANEQIHHFEQFTAILIYISSLPSFVTKYGKAIADKLTLDNIIHISYGFLTLAEGKMSTRKGNILTLKSLVNTVVSEAKIVLETKTEGLDSDEIERRAKVLAVAALKWYDLARDSSGDLVLDIPKILSFEGNTGVYQLYTLARINSILRKNILSENEQSGHDDFNKLNRNELSILKHCFVLTQTVEKVIDSYKPHYLTNYLYELSTSFNSWYAKYSITNELDISRKNQLLEFCSIIKNQLETGLYLLAINTLDEM
jgi:arginyl-tRNA synthetase